MKPPTVGPMMGPSRMPMPQMAIALPRSSAENMSTITACDSGTTLAPNAPCRRRKITICARVVAWPHSIEAITKPTTLTMMTGFRPKRAARNPLVGMMTASATM